MSIVDSSDENAGFSCNILNRNERGKSTRKDNLNGVVAFYLYKTG
jgi:hypothetical protein